MSRITYEIDEILRICRSSNMDEEFIKLQIRLKLESMIKNAFAEGFVYCSEHYGPNTVKEYRQALEDFLNNY